MIKIIRHSILFLLLLLVISAQSIAQPFYNEIQRFRSEDSVTAPPANPILFVGSSSFRMWKDVQSYFPGYTILNRGFGGSGLPHVIQYADDVIFRYNPRQIVIYCGENDLGPDVKGEYVSGKFKELFQLIRSKLPEVPIAYISMKPSPRREKFIEAMQEGNEQIKDFLSKEKNTAYIDVFSAMRNADGSIKKDIFLDDQLHMNAQGYKIWQPLILPHLIKD